MAVAVLSLATGLAAQLAPGKQLPDSQPMAEERQEPWRLQSVVERALGRDTWLTVSGETRWRWEGIDGQFRANPRLDFSDNVLVERSSLLVDYGPGELGAGVEVLDSRLFFGSAGTSIGTDGANPIDFLQIYARTRITEFGGGSLSIKGGRQTLDLGSRRLVARNNYRNTINSFTGVDLRWQHEDEPTGLHAIWFLPVRRLPNDVDSLLDGDPELDDEDFDRQFFGLYYERMLPEDWLAGPTKFELYGFGLLEEGNETRRRELFTGGMRLLRKRRRGEFDFEVESMIQLGDSRLSRTGPTLDHVAHYQKVAFGYTFDTRWRPNLRLSWDYASGDEDPNDGDNNRFDTLFGARRFEYGPTVLYGAIARSNISTPEVRLTVHPLEDVVVFGAWRGVWLASETDAWTTAGVVDPTGAAGNHVGQQFEARVRWEIVPKRVRFEIGGAFLLAGEFQEDAPNGQPADTTYGYTQIRWQF